MSTKPIIFFLLMIPGIIIANAQGVKVSAEIDPNTFVFNGYSAHLRLQSMKNEHLLVGVGTYAMNLPSAIVDFNPNNKDEGWKVRINQGYSMFGEYHFRKVNNGFFLGSQIGIQQFKVEKDGVAGSEKFINLLAMGYAGYTIPLWKSGFYVKPWAGLGYTKKLSGINRVGDQTYDIAPITMFATFHVGYTF